MFDSIRNHLANLNGPNQFISQTDPTTGEVTRVPLKRPSLAQSILSGALVGLFEGGSARDKEGRPAPALAATQGFAAGKQMWDQRQQMAQQQSDADIERRQSTIRNNMEVVKQQVMMTHQMHVDLQETADRNAAGILADAATYDHNLSPADLRDDTKKAIIGQHMTYDQALTALKGQWSNNSVFVDGSQDVRNPDTGQMEATPTYSVLNSRVQLQMNADQAKEFARFKSAYENAYQVTGGNLTVGLHNYAADQNQLNSLEQTEAFFERQKEALGIKGAPDFAQIAREGGQPVLNAVHDVQVALGQGGDATDALRRLSSSGGGQLLLSKMGISQDQVDQLWNKKQREAKLAAEGGMGEKSPAPAPTVAALRANINKLPPDDRDRLMTDIPQDGNMTMAQVEKLTGRIDQTVQQNKENAVKKGGTAGGDTDLTGPAYIASLEPTERALVNSIVSGHIAADRMGYLLAKNKSLVEELALADPNFDTGKVGAYLKTYVDFTSGNTSKKLNAGGTALLHLKELHDLNTSASHIPGTQAHAAYENKVDTVATELATFYGDSTIPAIASIKDSLNSTLPGNRNAAIKTQAKSMGDKLDSYAQQWSNAAPSAVYEAQRPDISPAARQARAVLDPNYKGAPSPQPQAPQAGPVKQGYVRFQASDGNIHDIPQANLKAAQQRDPGLKVQQ
jgi:hypothetical protein